MTPEASAFSPLRHRTFAALWLGMTAAYIGSAMQSLGAQWFLVSAPGGAPLVPLVQACLTLPASLLALPAGVLADSFDRRRLLVWVQSSALVIAVLLTILSIAGLLTPFAVLIVTALLASATALTYTPFQALIPDLVTKPQVPPAQALVSIGANSARIFGPAIAGLAIAASGVSAVFALNAFMILSFLIAALRWDGRTERTTGRERFMPALRTGVRYVRHSPYVLKVMLRGFWFTTAIMALMSLLPLRATVLGANSAQLGLLIAAQGAGAILGALLLPLGRRRLSSNGLIAAAFAVGAVVLGLMVVTRSLVVIAVLMAVAGWCWTSALITAVAAVQAYLPAWVRARGLAMWALASNGGMGVGALLSGWIAVRASIDLALALGSVALAVGATTAIWLPLQKLGELDRTHTGAWPEPGFPVAPDDAAVGVVVTVTYRIRPEHEADFLGRALQLRRIRLRSGATHWQLLRDAQEPECFLESYTLRSWSEYEQLQADRLVASDQAAELAVRSLSHEPVRARHYFRADP